MGEAKRREKLGLPPREIKSTKKEIKSTGKINQILNKYPFLPYIFENMYFHNKRLRESILFNSLPIFYLCQIPMILLI